MKIEDLTKAWRKKQELDELKSSLKIAEACKANIRITSLKTSDVLYTSPKLSRLITNSIIQEYKERIAKIEKEIEEL